jgi:hypothetical protein
MAHFSVATATTTPHLLGYLRPQPHRKSGKVGTLHQRAMLAYRNAGRTTAADYLAEIGADADTIRRFASPFGRKVAQAHRAATGNDPAQSGAALVRGQLMRVYAYADRALLDGVARDYHATATLVTA